MQDMMHRLLVPGPTNFPQLRRGNRFLEMQRELERAGREIMDENEEFARREREGAVNGMGRDNIPGNEQARAEGAPEAELNRILELVIF